MSQSLIQRAFVAYLQTDGTAAEQPTSKSSVETIGNLRYVVLRNERRLLAVYRVRNSGLLRRMRRWPLALSNVGRESTRERADALQREGAPA
jgi:hypothetical protein